MNRPRRKTGFVLVLILLLVVICGTVLASSARRCGQAALQAAAAQRDLQCRWGGSSSSLSLLSAADAVLENARRPRQAPPAQATASITMGDMSFDLLLSDESAKANMNTLAQRYQADGAGLLASLDRLQAGSRRMLPVDLHAPPVGAATSQPARYESFDQVFVVRPEELVGPDAAGVARRLTFWSQDRVNIRRADMAVLRELLQGRLNESQLVLLDQFRCTTKDFTAADVLAHLELTEGQVDELNSLTTDVSDSFSVWVTARVAGRAWHHLYVLQAGAEGSTAPRRWAYEW